MTESLYKTVSGRLKRRGSAPTVKVNEKNGVVWLSYPALEAEPFICHGFSTRLGGVSRDHLSEMNLSFQRGDDPENVHENFKRIAAAIGFDEKDLVLSQQTHTTNIRKVTQEDRGRGITRPLEYTDVDGLITDVPGLVLGTSFADCVPLFFADPVHKAVGLSHSGWKGTVGKIGKRTVERMTEEYGTDPADIIAAIGPSICQSCYEVSEDVIAEFREAFEEKYHGELFYGKENGKYQLDLWKANELILLEAGILREHISVTDVCTCCNPDILFSHRASKGMRGNLEAFLSIR